MGLIEELIKVDKALKTVDEEIYKLKGDEVVSGKIAIVSDETCRKCSQLWQGECRAYTFPHSDAERRHREKGYPLCKPGYEK